MTLPADPRLLDLNLDASPAARHFCQRFGIQLPIIQGPMNGASPPPMVAEVSAAGGLGSLAASLLSPAAIIESAARVRALTPRPFALNLFVLRRQEPPMQAIRQALDRLKPIHAAIGLPPPEMPAVFGKNFDDQLTALIEAAPAIASFTFGALTPEEIRRVKRAGCLIIGTSTNAAEAKLWEELGADAVCAQGCEAGGHRATFIGEFEHSAVGTFVLVPRICSSVKLPVIATGGVMDGRGAACALQLGAAAVQLGTAFLSCPESGIAACWREALHSGDEQSTRLTRVFSGRPARGIVNEYMTVMQDFEALAPAYPFMNALTGPMRKASAASGNADYLSLWAGQGVARSRFVGAHQLMTELRDELRTALCSD